MSRHEDFEKLYNHFVSEYGAEQGKSIYYAYLHNEGFNEEISLESQKNKVDAIQNNFTLIQKNLGSIIQSEKTRTALIIEKYMQSIYDEGIKTAATELSLLPSELGSSKNREQQIKILQDNSKKLMFSLFDDVEKEITLLVTNLNLNEVAITNTKLKAEIQSIFSKYQGRLNAQIVSETDRAFNTALEFGYKKSGLITHKQWISVIDNKTSSTCQTLNGEIVEIGKPFSIGVYTPPAHVNCRSRIVPLTLSEVQL